MTSLFAPFLGISALEIWAFIIPFLIAVFVDIGTHKSDKPITIKNAAFWSSIWVACAALFGVFVYHIRGGEAAALYASGFLLEKSLAVDNLFAFYLVFKSFGLTSKQNQHFQHTILYWGILGAVVFRVIFLGLGAFLANLSPLVLIAFGAVVLWTVYKMWTAGGSDEDEIDYTQHWANRLIKRVFPTNPSITGGKFFSHGVTPLFACLCVVELTDVVFAFDSVPVIAAVVRDPYLMITSSLWAAAGLRSLYFLLIAAQGKLWALDKAIMLLLVFVSCKLIAGGLGFHLANYISLSIVATILAAGTLISIFVKPTDEQYSN